MIQNRWQKITKACNRTWNFALAKCFYLRCKHNYNSKSNQTGCISKDKWYSRHIVLHILISILECIILFRNLALTENLFLSLFYSIHYPTQIEFSLSQDKGQCDTLELLSLTFVSDIEIWLVISIIYETA